MVFFFKLCVLDKGNIKELEVTSIVDKQSPNINSFLIENQQIISENEPFLKK